MQELSQKSVKVAIEITVPEISSKQLQFDPDPESGNPRSILGKGGFGIVYAGHYQDQAVAIKSLHVTNPKLTRALHQEAALMFRMASPYTVTLHGIYEAPKETALVMERMNGGSLFDLLQKDEQDLPWPLRYRLSYEIAEGVWVLHQQFMVHRDLKSMNVLLDENLHAKITDFGFSKLRGQISSVSASSKHSVGTPAYKAPELVAADNESDSDDDAKAAAPKKNPYSPYSDIYAYGVILWELATRHIPFEGLSARKVEKRISTGKTEKIPADCPPELAALIQACWAMKPAKRPRTDEVVEKTKALYLAAQAPAAPVQPPAADEKQDYIPAPWHMDPATKAAAGPVQNYARLPAGVEDMTKVVGSYQRAPVPGYHIKRVEVVYNPRLNRAFGLELDLLDARHTNPKFEPKWRNEPGPSGQWRRETHAVLEAMAAPHRDPAHPHLSLIPMWHATKQEVLNDLFTTGFANLAEVDSGFFGKGIYSAGEAKYSYTVYGKMYKNPALLMNWVATYSAYPVIDGDMAELQAKANLGSYDGHFIPVRPQNPNDPNESFFIPCAAGGQPYQYTELVVFNPRQCLPRYVVELQSDLLPTPADIQEAALKAQAEQQQKAHAQQQAEQAQKQQAAQQAAEQAQKQAEAAQKEQQKLEEIEKAKTIAVQEAVAKAQLKADQEAKAALAKAKQEADQQAKAQAEAASKQAEKMKQLEAKLAAAEAAARQAQAEAAQKSQTEQTQKAQVAAQQAQFQAEAEQKAAQTHKAQTAAQTEQAKKAQEAADQRLAEQLAAQQPQPPAKAARQEAGWLSKLGLWAPPKAHPNPQAAAGPDDGKEADIPSAHPQDIAEITELLKWGKHNDIDAKLKLPKSKQLAVSKELFLLYVAAGEQDRAQAMLKTNPQLACVRGTVTDLSGRTFEDITGFQYAVWALDWHMWKMMFNVENPNQGYLTPAQAAGQIEGLAQGKWVKTYGMHFDFAPLTTALDTYVQNFDKWSWDQREAHWCQQVGGAQLWLPAHVINEYCRPDRSFYPTPGFVEATLPRTMKTDEGFWFTAEYNGGKLSVKFGVARGVVGRAWVWGLASAGRPEPWGLDDQSMIALEKTRLQQLEELKSTLTQQGVLGMGR